MKLKLSATSAFKAGKVEGMELIRAKDCWWEWFSRPQWCKKKKKKKRRFNPPLCTFFSEPGFNITEPKVKVLGPAENECGRKTLVCVAEGFYPDHVTMSWEINGVIQTKGVATDSKAKRDGQFYKISSRLRVPEKSWFTAGTNFTCIVKFYNGTEYITVQAAAFGIQGTFESRQSEDVLFVGPYLTLSPCTLLLAKAKELSRGKYVSYHVSWTDACCVNTDSVATTPAN